MDELDIIPIFSLSYWLSCQVLSADYQKWKLIVSSLVCTPIQLQKTSRGCRGSQRLWEIKPWWIWQPPCSGLTGNLQLQASGVLYENMDSSPEPWAWLSSFCEKNKCNERVKERKKQRTIEELGERERVKDRKESKWCENMCVSMFVEGKAVFMLTFTRPSVFVF